LAGVPLGQMMTILTEFGVESRLQKQAAKGRLSPGTQESPKGLVMA